jgi:hypothetical protein
VHPVFIGSQSSVLMCLHASFEHNSSIPYLRMQRTTEAEAEEARATAGGISPRGEHCRVDKYFRVSCASLLLMRSAILLQHAAGTQCVHPRLHPLKPVRQQYQRMRQACHHNADNACELSSFRNILGLESSEDAVDLAR